jgi:hypothetical protein
MKASPLSDIQLNKKKDSTDSKMVPSWKFVVSLSGLNEWQWMKQITIVRYVNRFLYSW